MVYFGNVLLCVVQISTLYSGMYKHINLFQETSFCLVYITYQLGHTYLHIFGSQNSKRKLVVKY